MYPTFTPEVANQTPFLFFTGKGGVGKTSTASATAVSLADSGKKVLIVSTDPASNLQDVFGMELSNEPQPVKEVEGLYICNLDPEEAAKHYRDKVIGPYKGKLPKSIVAQMEEQLSGACTVEIAAFDEFTNLLADKSVLEQFDHILFDTAPTGHTLRLLKLPTAWNGFLEDSTHGASCLGPLAGLTEKKELYEKTVHALSDREKTTLILVSRPDVASFKEAERASIELNDIGVSNQFFVVNGLYQTKKEGDSISEAFYAKQQKAIQSMSPYLKAMNIYQLPFVSYSLTGINNLSSLFNYKVDVITEDNVTLDRHELESIQGLVENYSTQGTRVIMTMGKGGVGKTTIASLLAVGLVEKGHRVHLTTTDPAAHIADRFQDTGTEKLSISRINPEAEVEKYKQEVLNEAVNLGDEARAYLEEDLRSPCTEEIAVFHAFANVVARADNEIVIIDTAPTGHTLLLLDASQSYHKELERSTGEVPESVKNLLPRLRNAKETDVVLVTLPEATPVLEAERLQKDLKRAGIHPQTWVINQSLYKTEVSETVLRAKANSEKKWIKEVSQNMASQTILLPWLEEDAIGYDEMRKLTT
ncbi:arsenical pump-driving ATPase [Alkalihalobacillus pseudalcaliphilus]|uniref:arsenical pump-driving ATPase n=1 Tax=Alkalihalobacillus pseudalcaliphilus TaxID=79884 RepID=UPI00064DFA74|nr:arsenical pump-driving ATPase [Alkalihalobacillus pseudalcaliphilus]KMK76294.1 arsenic ABC transporter ATPase [Alkalihalobacillus pseudalcaliphilus]